ncbi:MAG: hypothetical protein H8E35_04290, partial [Ardenticatenia bacterium]|nr:hypothetical protein [Ardenticatenia bacterium]
MKRKLSSLVSLFVVLALLPAFVPGGAAPMTARLQPASLVAPSAAPDHARVAETLLATGAPPTAAEGPLPDKFLFAIGAQASVGRFDYPRGMSVAPDGTVYLADRGNHRIQRFSASGQFLGKWGSYGSGDGQFDGAGGVAVAPDGTVYVADCGNDRIQR